MNPVVQWQTASPLWEEALKDKKSQSRFKQPALLRFSSDDFMEDLQVLLDKNPSELKDEVARHETWEDEKAGWIAEDDLSKETEPLKLFQPAHSRFYLVTASLVCKRPGLPDKKVNASKKEKISFVLRRLVPENNVDSEYSWNGKEGWQKVIDPTSVPEKEERLPMFPVSFKNRDRDRRLLAGFIPASSRETFQAPDNLNPAVISQQDRDQMETEGDPFADPRLVEFDNTVFDAADGLNERASYTDDPQYEMTNEEANEVFLFMVLDLAIFLKQHIPNVWDALKAEDTSMSDLDENALLQFFRTTTHPITHTGVNYTFRWNTALVQVEAKEKEILEGTSVSIPMLNGLTRSDIVTLTADFEADDIETSTFRSKVKNALGTYDASAESGDINEDDPSSVMQMKEATSRVPKHERGVFYVLRCVYERPRCKPFKAPVVSLPSVKFQLATFFEPEAPTRPIRIELPEDSGIAGLRKFKKNVSMLMSDKLRKQMDRFKGVNVSDVEDGDIPKESGFSIGMICSFSIPIITICAFILLMIIVQLLNIVFWWKWFFKICFPIVKKS